MGDRQAKSHIAKPPSAERKSPLEDVQSYPYRSRRPLPSMFFLLPLVVVYEAALPIYGTNPTSLGVVRDIYAKRLLHQIFEYLGVTGVYLPGLIVLVVLLSWHVVSRDRWCFEPHVFGWMWVESLAMALPLFVLMLVLFGQPSTQWAFMQSTDPAVTWPALMVFSVGAGIYEELLFRLLAIALVHALLVDVLAMPPTVGASGAVAVSAIAFALYHFGPDNPFNLGRCVFYVAAGLYFALVYLFRGFGIVAGTHALYDMLVVGMSMTQCK